MMVSTTAYVPKTPVTEGEKNSNPRIKTKKNLKLPPTLITNNILLGLHIGQKEEEFHILEKVSVYEEQRRW